MTGQWRVAVIGGPGAFARDTVPIYIGLRGTDGTFRPAVPVAITPGDPLPLAVMPDDVPTLEIPTELAEALLSALASRLVGDHGDADLLATLRRTARERDQAVQRLDKLIDGIGRLGGNGS